MKRFALLLLLPLFLTACILKPAPTYEISVTVPAENERTLVFAEEILTPISDTVRLWTVSTPADTSAVLVPLRAEDGDALPSVYLTGLATEITVEADTNYRLGIYIDNPTKQDVTVVIGVGNAELSIACE